MIFKKISKRIKRFFCINKNKIKKAEALLKKPITHKFICEFSTDTLSRGKVYYGYISEASYKNGTILRNYANIINNEGKHIQASLHRFHIIEID